MKIKMSVKKKFLTILVLSIAVTSLLAFVMFDVTIDESTSTIIRQNFSQSRIFCAGVENQLNNMELIIKNFITNDKTIKDIDTLSKGLDTYEGYSAFHGITNRLISTSTIGDGIIGMCYYSGEDSCYRFSVSEIGVDFLTYSFIEKELELIDYKVVCFPDSPYVYAMTKQHNGYFVFPVDISRVMHKAYSIYGIHFDSCITILSGDMIIYSENEALSEIALHVGGNADSDSGVQIIVRDSETYIVNYISSSSTDWMYLYVQPTQQMYGKINYVIILSVALFIICILILFSVALILTDKITKKLSSLQKYMKNAEKGIYTAYPHIEKSGDELDELLVNYNSMVLEIQRLVEVDHKKQLLLNQTQFQALKAQINPHFIYNTLETIKCLSLENETEQVEIVIDKFGALLRASINMADLIPLSEEIDVVQDYIYIQKIRFGDRLNFTCDVDKAYSKVMIPHLILQPLVENSIKHVLEATAEPVYIKLTVSREEDKLAMSVTDSGNGFELPGSKPSNSGIGLENISERIKLYFGQETKLVVSLTESGNTCVKILIPLEG